MFDAFSEGLGLVTVDYGDFWKTQRKFGLVTLRGLVVHKYIKMCLIFLIFPTFRS